MSCFESSRFRRDFNVATPKIMKLACESLGWSFRAYGRNHFSITPTDSIFRIDIVGNRAYYYQESQNKDMEALSDALQKIEGELKSKIDYLQMEYAKKAVITHFEEKGFYYQSDNAFRPNKDAFDHFYMCAYTQLPEEDETDRKTTIEFTIMRDGSVISDSNYIPHDVHDAADDAMETLEKTMGYGRREGVEIKRKAIPEKYKTKAYCSIHNNDKIERLALA